MTATHRVVGNSAWRRGCRCDGCVAAHRAHLDRRQALSHARPPGHRRTTGAPLCPIHDGDVADTCLCGGL